jgi:putative ABC transport system substrate-binding protein
MRKNIVVLVVATAWLASVPLATAQKAPTVRRIGFLTMASMPSSSSFYEVFRQGLRELGYVEGQHMVYEEYREDMS